jgi:hypothetical protein
MNSFYNLANKINNNTKLKYMYYSLIFSALTGLTYFIIMSNIQQIIILVLLSYITNQMWFVAIHMNIHSTFMQKTKNELLFQNRFAYDHHYIDSSIFKKYWLPYRLIYFISFNEKRYFIQPSFASYVLYIVMYKIMYPLTDNTYFVGAHSIYVLLINYQSIVHE